MVAQSGLDARGIVATVFEALGRDNEPPRSAGHDQRHRFRHLHAGSGRTPSATSRSTFCARSPSSVILAHVALPPLLAQTRNFGVPLLILLSGWSIGLSLAGRQPRLWQLSAAPAEARRVAGLGLLAFYFSLFAITDALGISAAGHQPARILDSFLFGGGIGYVWVIRVNLLALVTPAARPAGAEHGERHRLSRPRVRRPHRQRTALRGLCRGGRGGLGHILANTPFYLIGYGAIFAIGLRLPQSLAENARDRDRRRGFRLRAARRAVRVPVRRLRAHPGLQVSAAALLSRLCMAVSLLLIYI